MADIQVDGALLHAVTLGDGPPFIALHGGLGFDHTYLRDGFDPFADVMRVTYFDQRGNGRSERVDVETITMRRLADDVDEVRRHLGHERIGLIGHSYGGFVALEYATTYPDRLTHLICVDTSPGAFEPTADELAERGLEENPPSVGAPQDDGVMARLAALAPTYVYSIDPGVVAAQLGATLISVEAMERGMAILGEGWTVAGRLSEVTCPTLVLCGRYDRHTTPECSRRIADEIPNAELVWFEKSAHFPWLEEREAFDAAVRDWLLRYP